MSSNANSASGASIKSPPRGIDKVLLVFEYAYLMRFPILSGFLLAIALPFSFYLLPSFAVGLFDARGIWSLLFIVWIAMNLSWAIMVTSRLVLAYAPDRFPGLTRISIARVSFRGVLLFALLAVPVLAVTIHGSQEISWLSKIIALVLGSLASLAMLFLAALIHFSLEPKGRQTASKVVPSFGFLESAGRMRPLHFKAAAASSRPSILAGLMDQDRLRSGHQLALIQLTLLLVAYVVIGFCYFPAWVAPDKQPAALFFALFLVTILTWFLSGAAFLFDRFRIPLLTALLTVSFISGMVHTDHKFQVTRTESKKGVGDLSPAEVVRRWKQTRGADAKALTIVATAGGGIRASAWTAKVLTELEKECPEKFSSSVLLVSSVSGGSVGTMYFVAAYEGGRFSSDQKIANDIWTNASKSSLSAVGWGLLYPDLLRTLPGAGILVPETFDRGWALENAWITGWKQPPNLSDWRADVAAGSRPAVIFNATAAESGQRFVIASTDTKPDSGTIQFARVFSGFDLPVATAARLSASFPYVSPITRASDGRNPGTRIHVADGGYYDNSGVLSAVDWLEQAAPALRGDDVLFITIDGSPSEGIKGQGWSWQRQIIGPVETVIDVRTSSQVYRDDLETQLAREALAGQGITLHSIAFNFPAEFETPLSWHLTPTQRVQILTAWDDSSLARSRDEVQSLLGCTIQ